MERSEVLRVLVCRRRDPHSGPDCVDPGQVDVHTEQEVGDAGEEAGGPVTQVVEDYLGQNHPDYTHGGVGPDRDLLDPDQFVL